MIIERLENDPRWSDFICEDRKVNEFLMRIATMLSEGDQQFLANEILPCIENQPVLIRKITRFFENEVAQKCTFDFVMGDYVPSTPAYSYSLNEDFSKLIDSVSSLNKDAPAFNHILFYITGRVLDDEKWANTDAGLEERAGKKISDAMDFGDSTISLE